MLTSYSRRTNLNLSVAAAALMGLCDATATAADAPAADAKAGAATTIAAVVVTAEHRTQTVQKTAAALTVLSGKDLTTQGRTTVQQILEDVPSVSFLDTLNAGHINNTDSPASLIAIRGLRTNAAFSPDSPSGAPAVASYVDGVFNGLGGLYDIDRIEVLRGPQGTLYGRSATAGVLSTHTADPSLTSVSGYVLGEWGSANLQHYSGALNLPLSSTLALRVSANHYSRDGYYSREGGALDTDDQRVKLLYKPSDSLSFLLGAAFQENVERSGGNLGTLTNAGTVSYANSIPVGRGYDHSSQFWTQANWNFGPATLTYIPSWRSYQQGGSSYDAPQGTGPGSPLISNQSHTPNDTFLTQEMRLASNGESRLKWQGGVFYYDNDVSTHAFDILTGSTFPPQGILLSGPAIHRTTENVGAFVETTFDFTDATRLTTGARYDYTKVQTSETDSTGLVGLPYTTLTINGSAGQRVWNNFTYKVRLEHDLAPTNMVYASASSAFLPGDVGITTLVNGNNQTSLHVAPYAAETLNSFEIGSKNQFLDRTLQINGAAFYYIFAGHQQTVQYGSSPESQIPAGSPARMAGVELELQYLPTADDRLGVNFNYVDAYYLDKPALFAQGVAQSPLSGVAPFSVDPSYTHYFRLVGDRTLTFRADAEYRSSHYWTDIQPQNLAYTQYAKVGNEVVGNVTLSLNVLPNTQISAYVHNIADTKYIVDSSTASINPTATTLGAARLSDPRTFGIILQQRF